MSDKQPTCGSENLPPPSNIVIFGATGDLAKRKLLPALLRMLRCGLLHPDSQIIGIVRSNADKWVEQMANNIREFSPSPKPTDAEVDKICSMMVAVSGSLEDPQTYQKLTQQLRCFNDVQPALFYCAIPPQWYEVVINELGESGLSDEQFGYRRIVIEKPFGRDHLSAFTLNRVLWQYFKESQVYRIDHYLGKESVQNLFVFRFANSILEPLWNRNYIDHIQISASEELGVEYRAPYYEKAGALRDMIQSHLMQVMTLVAMEPPVDLTAEDIRTEKVKVLRAVRPIEPANVHKQTLAAQYASGTKPNGDPIPAYCTEHGVAADSTTETFAAVKFYIDNWRWKGVPFVLWTGKRMPKRVSEVVVRFKEPAHNLFGDTHKSILPNTLIFRLQPDEGMALRMNAKMPGLTTEMQRMEMHAPYQSNDNHIYDAYEILFHDVLLGEATLFSHADEVEWSWKIVEPILNVWQDRFQINRYRASTWNVPGMDELMHDCINGWYRPI